MDQPGTDRAAILLELKKQLSDGCIDFTELGAGTEEEAQENEKSSTIMEEIAMEDETAMESFLETGRIAGGRQIPSPGFCRMKPIPAHWSRVEKVLSTLS